MHSMGVRVNNALHIGIDPKLVSEPGKMNPQPLVNSCGALDGEPGRGISRGVCCDADYARRAAKDYAEAATTTW